jgi:hypothetical protein
MLTMEFFRSVRKRTLATHNYGYASYGAIVLKLHGHFLNEYRRKRRLGFKASASRFYRASKLLKEILILMQGD